MSVSAPVLNDFNKWYGDPHCHCWGCVDFHLRDLNEGQRNNARLVHEMYVRAMSCLQPTDGGVIPFSAGGSGAGVNAGAA